MSAKVLDPDVEFIKQLNQRGGDTLKKCYQCATCSVVCPISPDNKPFPRKEMIAANWGLKDQLVADVDVWLCHQCGDCSTRCPRGAKPGDVLGAIRSYAIQDYAQYGVPAPATTWLAKSVNDPKKLPILLAIPAIIFIVLGVITGLLDFTPELVEHDGATHIAHWKFFSSWLVDIIFVPTLFWAALNVFLMVRRYVQDMHDQAIADGKVADQELNWIGLAKAVPVLLMTILRHDKFNECSENKARATNHMMVLFGFIALFIVTNIFFVTLYGSMAFLGYDHAWHSPYSQLNPVKWLANLGGIALLVGALAMIKARLEKDEKHATSAYQDWYLIGLVLALAVTGLGAELTRLVGSTSTYFIYFLHLIAVWCLFAYTPFSKLAHLVYRTVAMLYAEYAGREAAVEEKEAA